jgi:ABC-type Mn2+/Zn2+ transport system ATPase subunit
VSRAAPEGVALAAHDLTVAYDGVTALEAIELEVPAGASVAVLGPNGSGKSTLFAAAVGLVEPRSGTIEAPRGGVAYLPQHLHVEPTFPVTVRDVVAMGRWAALGWLRRPRRRDRELVAAALRELGIDDLAGRRLSELSGGQRQRALIAQVVAQDAELLLLDEPFTGVDRPTAEVIRRLVRRWSEEGRTVLVATHDLERSAEDFDHVIALNRRLIAFGPARETVSEAVLRETFAGRIVAAGGTFLDPDEHHH